MNAIISVIMIVIGFALSSISWSLDENLKTTCDSVDLKRCNRLILCTGVILMTVNLTMLSMNKESNEIFTPNGYSIFLLLLGIFITTLGAIIWINSKNDCETDTGYRGITIIGIIVILGSGLNKMIYK